MILCVDPIYLINLSTLVPKLIDTYSRLDRFRLGKATPDMHGR